MIDIDPKIVVMRELALRAGARIMEIYQQDDLGVRSKSDSSPVTLADEAADQIIGRGLKAAFPDEIVVTEENAESHGKAVENFFIVDPLDGTKEFIHRRGDFTVNIAYVENGIPVLGVVYAPARERLFFTPYKAQAVEEHGAQASETIGETTPISVSSENVNGVAVVASKSHRDADTDAYIAKYTVRDFKGAGSSLKFCLVATGEADLYPRLGRTMEWDTAAGDAVLRGAGGHVVRFEDHQPLRYGKAGNDNPYFVAYAPWVTLKPAN